MITTADHIDREIHPNGFVLRLSTTDQGNPPRSSFAALHINVSDLNDNPPKFDSFFYKGSAIENKAGVVAVVVNASDIDSGLSGQIIYSITGRNNLDLLYIWLVLSVWYQKARER